MTLEYLALPKAAIQEFISSKLDTGEEELRAVFRENFPKEWLTSQKLSEIREKVLAYIDAPPVGSEKQEIIPRLDFLNRALAAEYADKDAAKERIEKKLKEHLAKNRTRSRAVESLLISLKPEHVSLELYREVVHRGISQMLNSARTTKSAYKWYEKAKSEGWLDESEIPEPKLQKLNEYGELLEKTRSEAEEKGRQKESEKGLYRPRRRHGIGRLRKKAVRRPTSAKSEHYVQKDISSFPESDAE